MTSEVVCGYKACMTVGLEMFFHPRTYTQTADMSLAGNVLKLVSKVLT